MIGFCPPGYVVEMENGDLGIVLKNRKRNLNPKVLLIKSRDGIYFKEKVVDLSSGKDFSHKVVNDYRSGVFDIDVKKYIDNGLIIDGVTC